MHRPAHTDVEGRREAIGILANDNVALFEPKDALGLDAKTTDTVVSAGVHQGVPNSAHTGRWHMDLEGKLAHKTGAQDAYRIATELSLTDVEVRESVLVEWQIG